MQPLHQHSMGVMEEGISVTSCVFEGSNKEYIVVGTAQMEPEEQEPSKGRILVFEVLGNREENNRRFHLAVEKDVKGAVFSLVVMNGKLVAGIGSKVNQQVPFRHV